MWLQWTFQRINFKLLALSSYQRIFKELVQEVGDCKKYYLIFLNQSTSFMSGNKIMQTKIRQNAGSPQILQRMINHVILLERMYRQMDNPETKETEANIRRFVSTTTFIIARAKKDHPGNFYRSMIGDRYLQSMCAKLCVLVAHLIARVKVKLKQKAILTRFLATCLNPKMMGFDSVKTVEEGIKSYAFEVAAVFGGKKGIAAGIGIALKREKDKNGILSIALTQVALRALWLSETIDALEPMFALVSHVLTVGQRLNICSKHERRFREGKTKNNKSQIVSAILQMSTNGELDRLQKDGITAPPIAFLFGNMLSLTKHFHKKLLTVPVALPVFGMLASITENCGESHVRALLESTSQSLMIASGSLGIGAGLSKQLEIAFTPGTDRNPTLLFMPFKVIFENFGGDDPTLYMFKKPELEILEGCARTYSYIAKFHKANPTFIPTIAHLLTTLCRQWPSRRRGIQSALAYTTPLLIVFFQYLEITITPLSPPPSHHTPRGGDRNDSDGSKRIKGRSTATGYQKISQEDEKEEQDHKKAKGKQGKRHRAGGGGGGFFSFLSKSIAGAIKRLGADPSDTKVTKWVDTIQTKDNFHHSQGGGGGVNDAFIIFAGCFSSAIAGLEMEEFMNMHCPVPIGEGYFFCISSGSSSSSYGDSVSLVQREIANVSMALLSQMRQRYVRIAFCSEITTKGESLFFNIYDVVRLHGNSNQSASMSFTLNGTCKKSPCPSPSHAIVGKRKIKRREKLRAERVLCWAETVFKLPFLLTFEQRATAFRNALEADAKEVASMQRRIPTVNIRRAYLVEDGWEAIKAMGPGLKQRIAIRFIDKRGQVEAGLDMGGPFKEFLESLCREVFREDYGLFKSTELRTYYPNDASVLLDSWHEQFEFVGKVLGKALMEGHLIDVRFASFFLNLLLSRSPHFDDLKSLDGQLYRNLLFVKNYEGRVTRANRVQYITAMADYHLSKKIYSQELKILLSGSEDEDIDVDDLRRHSQVDPRGSFPSPSVLSWFWSSVKNFSPHQKRLLLKFVTACSHPPLMGFKYLSPPFTIRFVPLQEPSRQDSKSKSLFSRMFGRNPQAGQLPTSATCFNMLKLPLYRSQKALTEKLVMAIEARAGFDLQ
eukprot:jgi/Bigna1/86173/estExt_fgenesh1_pg.C_80240